MKQKNFWLKLIGVALLLHVALIALSIIEVAIYSYMVSPGHDKEFYSEHANQSGPWVSAIFGSLFMFLLVRRFIKRFSQQHLAYAIWLPVIYITIDFILLLVSGYEFKDLNSQFVLAKAAKVIAVLLAYFIYSTGNHQNIKSNTFI